MLESRVVLEPFNVMGSKPLDEYFGWKDSKMIQYKKKKITLLDRLYRLYSKRCVLLNNKKWESKKHPNKHESLGKSQRGCRVKITKLYWTDFVYIWYLMHDFKRVYYGWCYFRWTRYRSSCSSSPLAGSCSFWVNDAETSRWYQMDWRWWLELAKQKGWV